MKITAKFANTEGQVLVATFDQEAGTVQDNLGRKGTYTAVPGSQTIEIKGDETVTIKVADPVDFKPGFSTKYTASNGKSGTVTIEAIN